MRFSGWASRWFLAAALPVTVVAMSAMPAVCRAQAPESAPEIENAKHSFEGVVVDRTFVRSGPSDTFYPTQNIEKGANVIVVAKKGNWLKIQPPEGSFSYIQKAFVNKYGDGKSGKVTTPTLIVRAGSSIQPQLQWAVQTKLDIGQDVAILGEENEYFKIRPPESAFLYIKADEVKPVRVLPKSGERPADPPALTTADPTTPMIPVTPLTPTPPEARVARPPRTQQPQTQQPQTLPTEAVAEEVPTTGPSGLETVTRLQKLEADFSAASGMPLTEQPIEVLLAGYQGLASSPTVPEPTRKMADARAATLKARAQARQQFVAYQKQQVDQASKLQAQVAEGTEIVQRIKKIDVRLYAAVGTLRPSTLQVGNGPVATRTTLYRLTDPATGRTMVYLRTADPKYPEMLGQFVGVKGDITPDGQLNLKVINPTLTEPVNPATVNGSVAAEIVPPSMAAKAPSASASGAE
jgi:uncharacterized protein YgiM (DUF1202 family)